MGQEPIPDPEDCRFSSGARPSRDAAPGEKRKGKGSQRFLGQPRVSLPASPSDAPTSPSRSEPVSSTSGTCVGWRRCGSPFESSRSVSTRCLLGRSRSMTPKCLRLSEQR